MTTEGDFALAPVRDFLAGVPPFQGLPEEDLEQATTALLVSYHRRGERFEAAAGEPGLRILRSGAVDIRDAEHGLVDRLGEGQSFALDAGPDGASATAIEDCLLYLLPAATWRELRNRHREFDRFFSRQRDRRLRRAARHQPAANSLLRELRTVMSTDLVAVAAQDPVQVVAQRMVARRVSSALVCADRRLLGIVTDRDLRTRLVAPGQPGTTPVAQIMSPEPLTIDPAATLFDATLMMTRHGLHHLPVVGEEGLLGIVTTSDLMLAREDDPVYLVQHISRQPDVAGIRARVAAVPALMASWIEAGMRAPQVGHILTAISDAVTRRLIALAEAELGPAPVPWCWLAFGSQARAEQLPGADQDNGIVTSDQLTAGDDAWFRALASRVSDGLNSCGYPYCKGAVMATTDQWRQPLAVWQETVRRWCATPTPDAVMRVSIFFDLRPVHGEVELAVQLQAAMLRQASGNSIFLAALAANVLDHRPPLGLFRRFVVDRDGKHRDTLDLKRRGVLPLTEIVRLHALAAGITAVNTQQRLRALTAGKVLHLVDARNIGDALHCIQQLRMQQQCEQIRRGEPPGNQLNPGELPRLAREQLRDAFTIIDEAQAAVRQRYRAGLA